MDAVKIGWTTRIDLDPMTPKERYEIRRILGWYKYEPTTLTPCLHCKRSPTMGATLSGFMLFCETTGCIDLMTRRCSEEKTAMAQWVLLVYEQSSKLNKGWGVDTLKTSEMVVPASVWTSALSK